MELDIGLQITMHSGGESGGVIPPPPVSINFLTDTNGTPNYMVDTEVTPNFFTDTN